MNELKERVRRLSLTMSVLFILFGLGWGLTTYKTVFSGLILGSSVSLINALYTAVKVHQFSERIAAGYRPRSLGILTRFSMVALAALIVIRYPDIFSAPALVVGLSLTPIILWIDGLISSRRFK